MATHSLQTQSLLLNRHRHQRFPSMDAAASFLAPSPSSYITTFHPNASSSIICSSTAASTSSVHLDPTPSLISLDVLSHHLAAQDFWKADEETRRLLVALAGEGSQKRGYVYFSEVQFVSCRDLENVDELWRRNSGGRFGYSVQRKVWEKSNRDFTTFFIKVGWMKKLETEGVEQYNYRAFPGEFTWELKQEAPPPEGHLPLTNCLRGTRLLETILTHHAFKQKEEDAIALATIGNSSNQRRVFESSAKDYTF